MNMKILNIIKPKSSNIDFIEALLSKKIINDFLFDKTFFYVIIQPENENYEDYLYRVLWEKVYTKQGNSIYDQEENKMILTISLSEMIGYIYKAVPPILKDQVPDSITSLDSIIGLLKQFLMDDNGGHLITYLSIFKNHIHFEPFETIYNYDTRGIAVMREHKAVGLIANIVHASVSFSQLIDMNTASNNNNASIQLMFHSESNKQSKRLCVLLNEHNDLIVNNIKHDTDGLYVMTHGVDMNIDRSIKEVIYSSYSNIINK